MSTSRLSIERLIIAVAWAMVVGCAEDAAETSGPYRVSGVVTRTIPPRPDLGGDGKGSVLLFLSRACATASGGDSGVVAERVLENVDLSQDGQQILFEIADVPDGTYQLSAFLQEDPAAADGWKYPVKGDIVMFGAIAPRCVETVVSGNDVQGVVLDLNYVMEFDLPGVDGGAEADGGADTDTATETETIDDDGNVYRVAGIVTRSVKPGLGGDGVGPLYMLLSDKCMSTSGNAPDPVAYAVFPAADLAADGSSYPFVLEGVPNGVYQLNGFLDDVTNATEDKPFPGKGDLVSFGGIAPKCKKVVVDGGDVTGVDFDFNMVMQFNLPG